MKCAGMRALGSAVLRCLVLADARDRGTIPEHERHRASDLFRRCELPARSAICLQRLAVPSAGCFGRAGPADPEAHTKARIGNCSAGVRASNLSRAAEKLNLAFATGSSGCIDQRDHRQGMIKI